MKSISYISLKRKGKKKMIEQWEEFSICAIVFKLTEQSKS